MTAWWAALERLRMPRNYRQLVRHVARHLDWYLDPTQRVKPPVWVAGLLPSLFLAAMLGYGGALVPGLPFLAWLGILNGFILGMGFTARSVEQHRAYGSTLKDFKGWRQIVQSAELYYYLREAYSECRSDSQ
jgi:hypothetical protein